MLTIDQIDLADIDFFVQGDMYEAFAVLREQAPVQWQERKPGRGFWSLTRYEDVVAVYRDPRGFSSEQGVQLYFGDASPEQAGFRRMMILLDPPRHPKMRQVLSRRFTPHAVKPNAEMIRRISAAILDSVVERGECDFVRDIAAKLPTAAICEMMGIAREHWELMFAITNETLGRHDEEYAKGRTGRETAYAAQIEARDFFVHEAARRRVNPTNDLISALVHGAIEGEPLTSEEISFNCLLLILGGQETTRNATSGGMLALMQNPDQGAAFAANPDAPAAVEEFLRWTTPITHIMRTATCDAAIGGQRIRKGDRVVLWNAAANRDPAQFADPEQFNISRTPNDHVAFGHGEHFCLGANLARVEMRVMFDEAMRRLPGLELAGQVEKLRSNSVAGIKRMPVRFSPTRPGDAAHA